MEQLTIITGTYKNPNLLGTTIKSILEQSFSDFKLIIVDDNDIGDIEIINKTKENILSFNDKRIVYIKNPYNIGVPFVFRKWINLVETKYFMLIGEGDKLLPDTLNTLISFLKEYPEASMVYGLDVFEFANGETIYLEKQAESSKLIDAKEIIESHLFRNNYTWSQSAAIYKTDLFKNRNIKIVNDHYWDFYFHLNYCLFSSKIGYINDYMVIRRVDHSFRKEKNMSNFVERIERWYMSLDFLNEFEFFIINKGWNIERYRLQILKNLFKQILFLRNYREIIYSTSLLIFEFSNIILRNLFGLILFPFNILIRVIKGIIK